MRKILAIGLIGIASIMVISISYVYWFVMTKWKDFATQEQMNLYVQAINNAPTLSNNFYQIYDKIHPNQLDATMIKMIGSTFSEQVICPCSQIYNTLYLETSKELPIPGGADFFFGWTIERKVENRKCFDYMVSKASFLSFDSIQLVNLKNLGFIKDDSILLNNYRGPHYASWAVFNKPLDDLDDAEIVELILRLESPSRYEQHVHSRYIEEKRTEYLKQIGIE